jgi:hypothetical protein
MESFGVGYSEKEPLSVSGSVDVILQQQMILLISDFESSSQISTLKPAFKDERLIKLVPLFIILLYSLQSK